MSMVSLTPEQTHTLVAVLGELDPLAPRENRRTQRHKVALDLWIRKLSPTGRHAVFKVMAANLSKRGVALFSRRKMSVGERFVLPLRFDDGGGRLMLCQVRNSRELAGGHQKIGGQFIAWVTDDDGLAKIPDEWVR